MGQVNSPFSTLLFDCDGVLQRSASRWSEQLADELTDPGPGNVDAFFAEIRAAEVPAMDGSADFADTLGAVLTRWEVSTPVEDVLALWQDLVVDPAMIEAVDDLTDAGLVCALGTNQHAQRAAYMQRTLGYERHFAPRYYSCEIGFAKPDPRYFHAIVADLGVPAYEVLFLDDVEENVWGAREAGLVAEHFTRDAGRPELDRILARHGLLERAAA